MRKFTPEQEREIVRKYLSNKYLTQSELADEYGTSINTINYIILRDKYKDN